MVRFLLRSKEGPRILLIALTGKSANLLLLDPHENVLATLKEGQQQIGQPYRSLPFPRSMEQDKEGMSNYAPENSSLFPISHSIEEAYQQKELTHIRDRQKHLRISQLRKAIKKTKRRIGGLQADLEKSAQYQHYNRYGELLKGHLSQIVKGQTSITVSDYFDDQLPELVIPLDPSKTAQGNMEAYFKKYRKFEMSEQQVRPRLLEAEQNLQQQQEELQAVLENRWEPKEYTLPSMSQSTPSPLPLPTRKAKRTPQRSGPFKKFMSTDDIPIYVGRNAKENEELTHRFAHSEDLWLHARGTPGSHVIVRVEKGQEVPHQTICDAATLALQYSDLKKSGKGEVIYTKKKWVKKAKGQPAGTVHVTQEKSLFIKITPARLEMLKKNIPQKP